MGYGEEPAVELDVTIRLTPKDIIDAFHGVYFSEVEGLRWFGVPVFKCPIDLWIYQEILCQTRPDIIIETGTLAGGSALFLAMMCQLLGSGRVVTIDIKARDVRPEHPLITYVTGDSVATDIVQRVSDSRQSGNRVMVILDSDHAAQHVLAELDAYAPLVTPDCYLVVEDTNLNGHPVGSSHGPGPWEAVEKWLPDHPEFEQDLDIERRHVISFNPRGYLRRLP